MDKIDYCKKRIKRMLKNSQTKVIFPTISFGLINQFLANGQTVFSNSEIHQAYKNAVKELIDYMGHDLHIGGKYYDAYPTRNLPKYDILQIVENNCFELIAPFTEYALELSTWIPVAINEHISKKLGIVPTLGDREQRVILSENPQNFSLIISNNIDRNPTNFEIFSFAILKVHLEKFACKIYRDSRASANDGGIDIVSNFGAVFQVKKLQIYSKKQAETLFEELENNFDKARIRDSNLVVIIDDISEHSKTYLIDRVAPF